MPVVAYPRVAASAGSLQLFVGDFAATRARPVSFTLNGVGQAPTALRELSSVRGAEHGVPPTSTEPRAFVGVYEFGGLTPGQSYRVGIQVGADQLNLDTRVLPERVASATDGGFDVLLASCFYRGESSAGRFERALDRLLQSVRPKRGGGRLPDCMLLMGDQVYLDLPTLRDFPNRPDWLARTFEENYRQNWQGSLAKLLASAPWACLPDDHEFWNNAPHPSYQNGNTWLAPDGAANWHAAANLNYAAFSQSFNGRGTDSVDDPLVIDVPPLSFFLADGRTKRDVGRAFSLTPACRQALHAWVEGLIRTGRVGIFVTGQSLFAKPVTDAAGKVADWEMPNYRDYGLIMAELGRPTQRMLLLTGDVHWGRVSRALNPFTGQERQEVIVSPSSLVATIGADQAKVGWNWLKGIVGRSNPWPRHSESEGPPSELRFGDTATSSYRCEFAKLAGGLPAKIQGDQLGLLSFDWTNARLNASITYFPIHDTIDEPVRVPLF